MAYNNIIKSTVRDVTITVCGRNGLSYKIVSELPSNPSQKAIYLVPNNKNIENNFFDEYMYIQGKWEYIGNTAINLDEYYKKEDVDNITSAISEVDNKQQAQIDMLLGRDSAISSAVYFNTYEDYYETITPIVGKYYLQRDTDGTLSFITFTRRKHSQTIRYIPIVVTSGNFLNPDDANSYYVVTDNVVSKVPAEDISDASNYINIETKEIYAYNNVEEIFTDISNSEDSPIVDLTVIENAISNLQDNKIDKTEKAQANGIATLNENTKVPSEQILFATDEDVDLMFFGIVPDPEPEQDYVDLGLPSGTMWAKHNIGANSARRKLAKSNSITDFSDDFGLYFAWGETQGYTADQIGTGEGQKAFSWNDYHWGTEGNITKYNNDDGKTILDPEDDAAYVATNGKYRMPTYDEIKELYDNTIVETIHIGNIYYKKFTSKNNASKYFLMPYVGYGGDGALQYYNSFFAFWSSSVYIGNTNYAHATQGIGGNSRYIGLPIRGVLVEQDYVDLGLPSGTKWATCNIGASTPEESGLYFAWGETQGYTAEQVGIDKQFSWNDYRFGVYDSSGYPNYGMTKYNKTDGKTVLEAEDDAAYVATNGRFRTPTKEEADELYNNTIVEYVSSNGIACSKYINKNDASKYILIPLAGWAQDGVLDHKGSASSHWFSSVDIRTYYWAYNGAHTSAVGNDRYLGSPIRGVLVE